MKIQLRNGITIALSHLLAHFRGRREEGLAFCVYGHGDFDSVDLAVCCYIDEYPQVTDDFDEIYPSYVVQNGLELWCRDELIQDVVSNVFLQYPAAQDDVVLTALKYYMKHDAYMRVSR